MRSGKAVKRGGGLLSSGAGSSVPLWRQGLSVFQGKSLTGVKLVNSQTYAEPGGGGSIAGITAYTSACVRTAGSEIWVVAQGGHTDSGANAAHRIIMSADAPAWELRKTTSTSVQSDVAYYADGLPSSRHGCFACYYNTQVDAAMNLGSLAVWGSGNGSFDKVDAFYRTTSLYAAAGTFPSLGAAFTVNGGAGAQSSCQNLATGDVYLVDNSVGGDLWLWSAGDFSVTRLTTDGRCFMGDNVQMVHDPVRNRILFFTSGTAITPFYIDLLDLSKHTITFSGATAGITFPCYGHYVPGRDSMLMTPRSTADIYELNLATFAVTAVTITGDAMPAVAGGGNDWLFGRWFHLPELGVSGCWRTNSQDLWVVATNAMPTQSSDFANRIAGKQVVWYHGFAAAAEVDQFRWSSGYGSGNDPLAHGADGPKVSYVSSGGPDGGGFMRLTYPVSTAAGGSYWWRPFAPLDAASTGRGVADPAANGTITTQTFAATDGSGTALDWGHTVANPGWHGSASDQAANPTKYQGGKFYVQVRVRRAQTPGAPPDTGSFSNITGKSVWLTTMNDSFNSAELVTYGQSVGNSDAVGVASRFNVYDGQNFTALTGGQPNATVAIDNITANWRYSGGWDTLMYCITPGTSGGTTTNRSRVEVWAQHDLTLHPEEQGGYVKVLDVTFSQTYSTGSNSSGSPYFPGWNGLILAIYHNGSIFTTSTFNFDYGHVIFSHAPIPAPLL